MSFHLKNWAHLYSHMTEAELALEPAIAALGKPYRAQHPFWDLGIFADFILVYDKIVIEVDGKSHLDLKAKIKDHARTLALMAKGWRVVRIWNDDAISNPRLALKTALEAKPDTREDLEAALRRLEASLPVRPKGLSPSLLKANEARRKLRGG